MKIAVTGGTGFAGRYLLREFAGLGYAAKSWKRDNSDHSDLHKLDSLDIEWLPGDLTNFDSIKNLVSDCNAVVHSAHWKPGTSFVGDPGPVSEFAKINLVGTLELISASIEAGVERFIFISSGAVYNQILDDRMLDEAHPCWPGHHYGATKAAIEKYVSSFSSADGYNICALRPTGIYGQHHTAEESRWFELIRQIADGQAVTTNGGAKLVHAADVAKAVALLLESEGVAGRVFNCCDRYISNHEVASIAKELTGSKSVINGTPGSAKHRMETAQLQALGMEFGGTPLLHDTIRELLNSTSDQ